MTQAHWDVQGMYMCTERDAPERLMRRIAELEAEHARLLAALPAHQRAHFRQRHASASSVPGVR